LQIIEVRIEPADIIGVLGEPKAAGIDDHRRHGSIPNK
jgi:hypothetical protein